MKTTEIVPELDKSENTISLMLTDEAKLRKAYMPFIKGGALFIKTALDNHALGDRLHLSVHLFTEPQPLSVAGKVVWVAPQNHHGDFAGGVGVQLEGEVAEKIRQVVGTI